MFFRLHIDILREGHQKKNEIFPSLKGGGHFEKNFENREALQKLFSFNKKWLLY